MTRELSHIPQFVFQLDGIRYALYVKSSDDPLHDRMFWLEVCLSETYKVLKPKWVSDAVAQLSRDRLMGVNRKKNSGPRTDWERNALWMVRMDRWRRERRAHGAKGTRRHYSIRAACEKVAAELKTEGQTVTWPTIRTAYERAKERFVLIFPYGCDHPNLESRLRISPCDEPLRLPYTYRLPSFCDAPLVSIQFQP